MKTRKQNLVKPVGSNTNADPESAIGKARLIALFSLPVCSQLPLVKPQTKFQYCASALPLTARNSLPRPGWPKYHSDCYNQRWPMAIIPPCR